MGTEAGQPLETIIRRKELERRAGNGTFAWGIGNSLGLAAHAARAANPHGEVDVLFTPMKSTPKQIDASPDEIMIWLRYFDANGSVKDLPPHMLITSRGGPGKRAHYALLCRSDTAIDQQRFQLSFDTAEVRNFVSNNPIGASQVTSVVRYRSALNELSKTYSVALRAKFHGEGFIRLTEPITLSRKLLSFYQDLCGSTSVAEWKDGVKELRLRALSAGRLTPNHKNLF